MEKRRYAATEAAVFCRVRERWGELSNMAPSPIRVGHLVVHHAEGLYQALRFPNEPWLRHAILGEKNPIQAKALSRANIALTRPDWERVRVQAMRWVLRQKLQHPPFQRVLLETGDRPIVELSYKDQFWGAKPEGHLLVGVNALGRLLMELRQEIRAGAVRDIPPPEGSELP